jgi:hypothetical protein
MSDPTDQKIDVDEIMRSIREKVRQRRESQPADDSSAGWLRTEELIAIARRHADVGAQLPPMTRMGGLQRLLAAPLAKAILRLAQLVTRDQRAFNHATTDSLLDLHERMSNELAELRRQIAALRDERLAAQARAPLDAKPAADGEAPSQAPRKE